VARWMLGLMQLQSDSSRTRAFDNFQKAINLFEELNRRAGIANNKALVDWYTYKITTLINARDRLRS
jgi:hypothetical protein